MGETPPNQRSEVARILAQISSEYEAAVHGLTGLALGTSQHAFITSRMERMGTLHEQLRTLVGDQAIGLVAEHLDAPAHQQDTQDGEPMLQAPPA